MPLRYGFEIETVGVDALHLRPRLAEIVPVYPDTKSKIREHHLDYRPGHWACTYDGSLDGDHAEVVSPISPPFEEVRRVIEALKDFGCKVNKKCGLHIHVSDTEADLRIQLPTFKVWQDRLEYCAKEEWTEMGRKYRSLAGVEQVAENHLEVRVFNGALSYPYLLWAWGMVTRHLIRLPRGQAQGVENNYELIPIRTRPKRRLVRS